MNWLTDFHFIRPLWLLLFVPAVGLWLLWLKLSDPMRGWRSVIDRELLPALTVGEDSHRLRHGTGLLLAWLLAILAVAGPTWRPEPSPFADDPVPVMVLLRAAETMDLEDIPPNRMERARLKVADFATARAGLPMGLIAYSGSAHLVLPPTRDTEVVATMASEIGPEIMPRDGDDLAGAIELAQQSMADTGGTIVVIADTVAGPGARGVAVNSPVYFLGVARPETPELDALRDAASAIGGDVVAITADSSDIDGLVRRTAQTPIKVSGDNQGVRWAEAGWWIVPLLALLVLAGFRRERRVLPQEANS